jgi:hypothetical protein
MLETDVQIFGLDRNCQISSKKLTILEKKKVILK